MEHYLILVLSSPFLVELQAAVSKCKQCYGIVEIYLILLLLNKTIKHAIIYTFVNTSHWFVYRRILGIKNAVSFLSTFWWVWYLWCA